MEIGRQQVLEDGTLHSQLIKHTGACDYFVDIQTLIYFEPNYERKQKIRIFLSIVIEPGLLLKREISFIYIETDFNVSTFLHCANLGMDQIEGINSRFQTATISSMLKVSFTFPSLIYIYLYISNILYISYYRISLQSLW